jgi:hypothetical protein
MRRLIACVFMYSLDGLLADEGTEYWQFCFGLPVDPADLEQKVAGPVALAVVIRQSEAVRLICAGLEDAPAGAQAEKRSRRCLSTGQAPSAVFEITV